jgi:hypothetical protein
MKSARELLNEIVRYVQPPRGCAVVLAERKSDLPPEPNWTAASGVMQEPALSCYMNKIAELRKSDPKVDWSKEKFIDGLRRIALWLSELDES